MKTIYKNKEEIERKQQEIEKLKKEILELKKEKVCVICGKTIKNDSRYYCSDECLAVAILNRIKEQKKRGSYYE